MLAEAVSYPIKDKTVFVAFQAMHFLPLGSHTCTHALTRGRGAPVVAEVGTRLADVDKFVPMLCQGCSAVMLLGSSLSTGRRKAPRSTENMQVAHGGARGLRRH